MKYIINESQLLKLLYSDTKEFIYEAKIDPNAKLWNVIKIPTKVGVNAYTATSNRYPDNALGPILNNAKTMWKKYGDLMAQKGDVGEGYLYAYLIKILKDTVSSHPGIATNARALRSMINEYFDYPEVINPELLTKAEAEELKRKLFNTDKDSFKHKGAAMVGKEIGNMGRPAVVQGKKKITGLKDTLRELFYYDDIQFYDNNDVVAMTEYGKDEMIKGGIPSSFADELNNIFSDPNNKIDPGTGEEFNYGLTNIPSERIKNMLKHYKNVIDQEENSGDSK